MFLKIIVPVKNEAATIYRLLHALQTLRERVIIVDGGSSDATVALCQQAGYQVISSDACRATQMNAGVEHAYADCYWFLHADCLPPADSIRQISQSCQQGHTWGFFKARLDSQKTIFRIIETMMNWRSCMTQVATGDQGIFITHELFKKIGGFPDILLMEDIAISKLLRRHSRGACITTKLVISGRRWENQGVFRTILLMWWLRLRYVLGTDPSALHKAYYG